MNKEKIKGIKKTRRVARTRAKISGTAERPRLNVYRSNREMYLQLIDDRKGVTLASAHAKEIDSKALAAEKTELKGKERVSYALGKLIARKAAEKKIESAVFDRSGSKYHGRIKAAAEGARDGGMKF